MVGSQLPRIEHVPPSVSSSAGLEAVELAREARLQLDPWEEHVLMGALGERPDGKWAAPEVGLVVPRQNGKGTVLEARELAGLFLLGERLLVHSAHQFDTSIEHFRRMMFLIEDNPPFEHRVKKVLRSHGEEGIELKGGQRLRFRTRTKGGGRGFTGDFLGLDEAMYLPEAMVGALFPTLSARPNPQVWYTGSAVDQLIHVDGVALARVRERALRGDDPELAYFEWSALGELADLERLADDREAWAQANPGMGIRIAEAHIARERRAMDIRTFGVERLGIGDWPQVDADLSQRITVAEWEALAERDSKTAGPVCFAFDVRPDRSSAAISVAGLREDGRRHVEVVDAREGTGWVVNRLEELVGKHESVETGIVYDKSGPAASLEKGLEELERRGVTLKAINAPEFAQSCGMLVDSCKQDVLRHLGSTELSSAIKAAKTRPLGDAWVWSRKLSTMDISPLVAATLALWGLNTGLPTRSVYEDRGVLIV